MSNNIQTTITGQTPPCLQQKIDKTRYLVEIHFPDTSNQSVEDKLKRVIMGVEPLVMDKDLLKVAMLRAAECTVTLNYYRPNGEICFTICDKIYKNRYQN